MGAYGLVMIDFKKSLYPTLGFIFFCSLISSLMRPDFNTMVAPLLMLVLRQGKQENFFYINSILLFTCAVDVAYLSVQSLVLGWTWAPTLNNISFGFSVLNIICKVFLILFNVITMRNWNDETPLYFQEYNPMKALP